VNDDVTGKGNPCDTTGTEAGVGQTHGKAAFADEPVGYQGVDRDKGCADSAYL